MIPSLYVTSCLTYPALLLGKEYSSMIIDCIDEICDIGVAWRIYTDERGVDPGKVVVYGVEVILFLIYNTTNDIYIHSPFQIPNISLEVFSAGTSQNPTIIITTSHSSLITFKKSRYKPSFISFYIQYTKYPSNQINE
jgi:hypothetical protein